MMVSELKTAGKVACCDRRLLLGGVFAGGVFAGLWSDDAIAGSGDAILQPDVPDDAAFIARAFKMRDLATSLGDQAYGAVVVRDKKIIGQSPSRVISESDPTDMPNLPPFATRPAGLRTAILVVRSFIHPRVRARCVRRRPIGRTLVR